MRKQTAGILLVVLVVLLPTWYAAAQPVEHAEEVGIDTDETDMRPLQSIVDTPRAFTPAQVGVVIWLALTALMAVLVGFHRFMDHMVRSSSESQSMADGGVHSWFRTENRWIAEFVDPTETDEGVVAIVALSVLTVVLAILLVVEFTTLARTQYFGLYVGGIFLALAGMTASYYAWFMPHVRVAEERYHD